MELPSACNKPLSLGVATKRALVDSRRASADVAARLLGRVREEMIFVPVDGVGRGMVWVIARVGDRCIWRADDIVVAVDDPAAGAIGTTE